jgi:hypothetical protein
MLWVEESELKKAGGRKWVEESGFEASRLNSINGKAG